VRAITPDELQSAEECFATGSAAEVVAIGRIDNQSYPVGPITRLLRDSYARLVRG